jgi:hypothetical protein
VAGDAVVTGQLDAVVVTDQDRAFVLGRYRYHLRQDKARITAMMDVRDALAITIARDALDCWPMSTRTLARFAAAENYVTQLLGSGCMAAYRPVWRGQAGFAPGDSYPRAARLARRTLNGGKF